MKVKAYIHSLKDHTNNRHVAGEAEIIEHKDNNNVIAEYNGVKCKAIFNPFAGMYYVDDVYGIIDEEEAAWTY